MKIGILCFPTYGGSGFIATELGKYLALQGHDIHFISYSLPRRLSSIIPHISYHEVSTHIYPPFEHPLYTLALASKIVEIDQRQGLDLLHVHYAIPHAIAAYLASQIIKKRGRHLPFITTLHGTDITITGQNPAYAPIVLLSLQKSDAITAVSHSLKKETLHYFNLQKPITVIPNFVDLARFQHPPSTNKISSKGKVIIHISTLRKVKRPLDVIEIFARIRQAQLATLYIIGDGPLRPKMERLAEKKGLSADIQFLGNTDSVESLLFHADVLLMPSEKESFGLAVLEAMAAGVPSITSNVGGLPNLITHGREGFVCQLGDVAEMANCALKALDNTQAKHLSAHAKQKAQQFDMHRIVPQYIQCYQQVLNHTPKREAN